MNDKDRKARNQGSHIQQTDYKCICTMRIRPLKKMDLYVFYNGKMSKYKKQVVQLCKL